MSHYTVMVITKDGDYEKALAPFDERVVVEPYLYKTKEDIIKERHESMENALADNNQNWADWLKEIFDWSSDEALHRSYVDYYKKECGILFDDDGNELTIHNPNSKWDWYCVGGRWSGELLRTKNGEETDHDQVKNLDFTPRKLSYEQATYLKRFWEINVEGDALKDNEKRRDYFCLYKAEYMKELYGDLQGYLELQANPMPHSLLYHGEWIEAGEVVAFGCDTSTEISQAEYNKRFKEIMSNLDPDDYITIIDCHI